MPVPGDFILSDTGLIILVKYRQDDLQGHWGLGECLDGLFTESRGVVTTPARRLSLFPDINYAVIFIY